MENIAFRDCQSVMELWPRYSSEGRMKEAAEEQLKMANSYL